MKRIRVGNIEIVGQEIIKYVDNEYYNKIDSYKNNGWVEGVSGVLSKNNTAISISLFYINELKITIGKFNSADHLVMDMEDIDIMNNEEWLNLKTILKLRNDK